MNLVLAYLVVTLIGILLWLLGHYGVTSIFKSAFLKFTAGFIGLTGFLLAIFGWCAMVVVSVNQFIEYIK